MTTTYTAILPDVGPIVIEHDGEDLDLVITPTGAMPAIISVPETEEWEPDVYDAALVDAGWQPVSGWEKDGLRSRYTCQVVQA